MAREEYIKRNIDKTIIDWFKGTSKALMILGARQIGKTESIKHFLKSQFGIEEDERLPILNIETTPGVKEAIISGKAEGGSSFIRNLFANAGVYADLDICKVVFIDEIQAISNSKKNMAKEEIKAIMSKLMEEDGFRFIFSGSLLGAKIGNLEEFTKELPGGITHSRMYPISFAEFVEYADGNRKRIETVRDEIFSSKTIDEDNHIYLLKKFAEYSFVGGMPKSVLAYFDNDGFMVSNSMDAISTLVDDYIQDTEKYYEDELNADIGINIFEYLLSGLKENDKKRLMKKLNDDPERILYEFIIDSDVGLLVKDIEELTLPISEQKKPKTYFNDVGFMRLLIKRSLEKYKKFEDTPKGLKDYFDVRNLDDVKNDFLNLVDNNGGAKMNGVGHIFEQIIAQDMKSNSYSFAYSYKKKPVESELEFILIDDYSAIEVKSGGFEDYPSSLEYAKTGKKVFFLTMLPYLGEYKTNFILLPIYALCFLNQKELLSVIFKEVGIRAKELLLNGKLPNTKGFC